jgi:hypothetical protein
MDVVLFTFAGRQPNMKLQAPLMHRILEEHPNARWDIWNLARTTLDAVYLQTLSGQRVRVFNQFWRARAYEAVYRYYARPRYRDTLFVKCDDDIVFIQTGRFGDFVDAIRGDTVTSALTINNGASTHAHPALWQHFTTRMRIPLLEVHTHAGFAHLCHVYFHEHWRDMLAEPVQLVDTEDWVSINMIGMTQPTLAALAEQLGTPSPLFIAGRDFQRTDKLGDEGAVNTMPRKILRGFTAAHLGFGPQQPTIEQFDRWRAGYADIAADYLSNKVVT